MADDDTRARLSRLEVEFEEESQAAEQIFARLTDQLNEALALYDLIREEKQQLAAQTLELREETKRLHDRTARLRTLLHLRGRSDD